MLSVKSLNEYHIQKLTPFATEHIGYKFKKHINMATTISILQGILAFVFLASGSIILLMKDKLKSRLSWLTHYSPGMVLFICTSKIAGAIGLLIPLVTGRFTFLIPLASLGIATIMALAFAYHIRNKEKKDIPATVLFFLIAMLVAIFKF